MSPKGRPEGELPRSAISAEGSPVSPATETDGIFGRRWFLALALRQVPAPEEPPPAAEPEPQPKEKDECVS
jgi:hypothetical protein